MQFLTLKAALRRPGVAGGASGSFLPVSGPLGACVTSLCRCGDRRSIKVAAASARARRGAASGASDCDAGMRSEGERDNGNFARFRGVWLSNVDGQQEAE